MNKSIIAAVGLCGLPHTMDSFSVREYGYPPEPDRRYHLSASVSQTRRAWGLDHPLGWRSAMRRESTLESAMMVS
jgi:hypothetical protein